MAEYMLETKNLGISLGCSGCEYPHQKESALWLDRP